jgi:hypothetical protein
LKIVEYPAIFGRERKFSEEVFVGLGLSRDLGLWLVFSSVSSCNFEWYENLSYSNPA